MDSLYDAPRRSSVLSVPDRPFLINGPTKDYTKIAPVVPEVSMICNNNPETPIKSYNTWKTQQHQPTNYRNNFICNNNNKENYRGKPESDLAPETQNLQILKKQVRFECNTNIPREESSNNNHILQPRTDFYNNKSTNIRPSLESGERILKKTPTDFGRNFQQIYMGNIPKRHLDLSVIDTGFQSTITNRVPINNRHSKENVIDTTIKSPEIPPTTNNRRIFEEENDPKPKTYQEFRQSTNYPNNDCITDILNYRSSDNRLEINSRQDLEIRNNTEKPPIHDSIKTKTTSEVGKEPETIKDLLKIIQQQNEQIILLQKQVSHLTEQQLRQQQLQPVAPVTTRHDYIATSTKHINPSTNDNNAGLSKFSRIDLMATSFEVSYRPQHQHNLLRRHKDFVGRPNELKIQEIREECSGGNQKNFNETSLHLEESLNVRNDCPSPVPSINIDMNQYDSSNDDEDEDSPEVSSSDIGVTFYNNLMEQVNNLLKETQIETKYQTADKTKSMNKIKEQTAKTVKEATLKHLRSIGVNLASIDDNTNTNKKMSEEPEITRKDRKEISFAVKQLLMKYLPDEQLAKIVCSQPTTNDRETDLISRKPDFSLASIEYMRKYNLIDENGVNGAKTATKRNGKELSKILDIKALKLQPKLL